MSKIHMSTHKIPNTIQFLPFRFHDLHILVIVNIGVKKFRSTQLPMNLLRLQHLIAYLKIKYLTTALKRKDLKIEKVVKQQVSTSTKNSIIQYNNNWR